MSKIDIPAIFGCNVFGDDAMRAALPRDIYQGLQRTREQGEPLSHGIAGVVAAAMKDWAVERGATHFTHWFQPMTGITAEKHDSFIAPAGKGKVILEFSGKELVRGESDASSFPSGGLRATFEARGYTAWDPTSDAFIKDGTLCIPTAFCSYSGEALDKKTPLLRSMEVLNRHARRLLAALGTPAQRVLPTVGPEQEYFLIDRKLYEQRKDLILTGRTLFGARPAKGQELDDHYYGNLKERINRFMKELDTELWKLGVYAKTKHNEVAPAQHELAPVFTTCNIAADHNQLAMEMIKKIAPHHDLIALLHEKPFEGVNGSGKHNNWGLATDTGENLLACAGAPEEDKRFLLILAAVIAAVDEYADLLRTCVASAGNDHRLGGDEAPPAILSVFLGERLTETLDAIARGVRPENHDGEVLRIGVASIPELNKDTTDRNRTSPFAFTGNKFEFRMPGSSASISATNTTLNTMVAELFSRFASALEACEDKDATVDALIRENVLAHHRILFNGNNYAEEWLLEAEHRGLPNRRTTVEAVRCMLDPHNVELFEKHGILTRAEVYSRYEVYMENYAKTLHIEADTMLHLARRQILPAVLEYSEMLFDSFSSRLDFDRPLPLTKQREHCVRVNAMVEELMQDIEELERVEAIAEDILDATTAADYYCETVLSAMYKLRETADALEMIVSKKYWPLPSYSDLLFKV